MKSGDSQFHSEITFRERYVWAIYRRVPLTCSVGDEPRTGKEEGEQARAQIFLEKRRKVHQEVEAQLHSSQHQNKDRHDQHRVKFTSSKVNSFGFT